MKAFDCKRCGTCCHGEGGIRVETRDIERIAAHLGMPPESFISRFCEETHGRRYIRSGDDGFCRFYDHEKQCLLHPVKPRPCASWPFYPALVNDRETWKMAQDACPGINPDCSFEDFVRQSKE